jgi:hypothetical protein
MRISALIVLAFAMSSPAEIEADLDPDAFLRSL